MQAGAAAGFCLQKSTDPFHRSVVGKGMDLERPLTDGERFVEALPEHAGMVRQHRLRYEFALDHIHHCDRVVDCATGSGYGAAMLAAKARSVLGVDVVPDAIDFAKETYHKTDLRFEVGSAYELPVQSHSIDVYCSFETIEHVDEPIRLLKEADRILTPRGKLIISTPNRVASGIASGQKPHNPFHVFEWSFAEFDAALKGIFPRVECFGQRIRCSNKFHPMYVKSRFRRLFGARDIVPLKTSANLLAAAEDPTHWQPVNFIAICSKS